MKNGGRVAYTGNCFICAADKTSRWYHKIIPNKTVCRSCYDKKRRENPEFRKKRNQQRKIWDEQNKYKSAKNHIKQKGMTLFLTKKDFFEKTQMCYYCYTDISNNTGIKLDRINNNLGYTKKNIVGCCRQCNISKNNYTITEFYNWIKKVNSVIINREKI